MRTKYLSSILILFLIALLLSCEGKRDHCIVLQFRDTTDSYNQIVVDIATRKIQEKNSDSKIAVRGNGDIILSFSIDTTIKSDGFDIREGTGDTIMIIGQCHRALLYGLGKFIRTSDFTERKFIPSEWRGISYPKKPIRGIYFATHFGNYYYNAPEQKVKEYLEDLALWGANTIAVWYDMHAFNGMNDSASRARIILIKRLLKEGNKLGLASSMTYIANEGYNDSPVELRAHCKLENGYFKKPWGYYYREVCPNTKGGLEYILQTREEFFKEFSDIQIENMAICAYDQGGCTCSRCAPWGTNGFLYIAEKTATLAKKYFPNLSITMSTWCFDHFVSGEWSSLAEKFNKKKPGWVDYLIASDGDGFPEFIVKNGVPGHMKLIGFPEICMEGMYPWGCYGANPRPLHWQQFFQTADTFLAGAFPYSEGIYDDINKVVVLQKLWNNSTDVNEIVKEYSGAEFGHQNADSISSIIMNLETNLYHDTSSIKKNLASQTLKSVRKINETLPAYIKTGWKWGLIYVRAEIDNERYNSGLKRLDNKRITIWQKVLDKMYYVGDDTYNSMKPTYQESWIYN